MQNTIQVEQIAAEKRERGEAGSRRNKGGESYNILSLAYTPDAGGEKLRLQVRVCTCVRAARCCLAWFSPTW